MTYAPDDLLAVRAYVQAQTGLSAAELGIAGDPAHASSGGYHEGFDDLAAAGRAPGPEYPLSDYSYAESPRDRGYLERTRTNAASAFDLGGGWPNFRRVTLALVDACEAGDPRTADIREVIYTPDGKSVRRWDRLSVRTSGDDGHLWHTHVSFFRDSEGSRDQPDNFLGLLHQLFEGISMTVEQQIADLHDRSNRFNTAKAQLAPSIPGTPDATSPAGLLEQFLLDPKKFLAGAVTAPVVMTEADRAAIIAGVVAGMPKPPTAAEVAEELARRIGNG